VLYDIGLRIAYEYDSPANAGRHLLRLMPANLPGEQRVILGYLDIQPTPAERFDRVDYFGNATVEIAFVSAHAQIEFKAQANI
jgi:transglutaminase-like putative cysteine protease